MKDFFKNLWENLMELEISKNYRGRDLLDVLLMMIARFIVLSWFIIMIFLVITSPSVQIALGVVIAIVISVWAFLKVLM